MHLSIKVIGQTAVVVKSGQIRTAYVAHLELLVPGRARVVDQRSQLALPVLFRLLRLSDPVELGHGSVDEALFAHDPELVQVIVDRLAEV